MDILRIGDSGVNVKLLQSLLNKIGYDAGNVDGVFGPKTLQAVKRFQENNALVADGVVGENTWGILNNILRGFGYYTITRGDTYSSIASMFYTTPAAIEAANPNMDPNNLQIGEVIVVPYGIDVVFTDIDYTYDVMEMNIMALKARYPFLEVGKAGKSVMGKDIYYIKLGHGDNKVLYNGAHHANEWITSPLLMKFVEEYSKAYVGGYDLQGYEISELFNTSSIYIVPMVNPDGVDFVLGAINSYSPYYQYAMSLYKGSRPLAQVWNANIMGVDLNLNYPAEWEKGKENEIRFGITGPAPQGYGGKSPFSEPETIAVGELTKAHDFNLVIAFHTQGEFIFWQFLDLAPPESLPIAKRFAAINGYSIAETAEYSSYAGYKDWFIQDFNKPGYTIEVGKGVNPIPIDQLNRIYQQNEGVMLLGAVI